ncbi:hypothetical protein L226DRAFT_563132 [Lentinus tigrinus ALCF2SS1-7]|nr:hypothetical protein L226DRAFT_563132 [Lentinus tigrinus ALCF2SS1-7]
MDSYIQEIDEMWQHHVDNSSRVVIPRRIPSEFRVSMPAPWLDLPSNPFSFCIHEEGISLQDILDNEHFPAWYWVLGMPDSVILFPERTWFHISWPGYRQYTQRVLLEHDGSTWSIALAIARAYESFLQEAREWDFQPDEGAAWQITGEDDDINILPNLRLHRLCWVNGEIYQADIELVAPRH